MIRAMLRAAAICLWIFFAVSVFAPRTARADAPQPASPSAQGDDTCDRVGFYCAGDSDCCASGSCDPVTSTCRAPQTACSRGGEPCTSTPCCAGFACGHGGRCESCANEGQRCRVGSDCCSDLPCVNAVCGYPARFRLAAGGLPPLAPKATVITLLLAIAWLLLFAWCIAEAWRGRPRPPRELIPFVLLFVFAAIARTVLSSWGPGDTRLNLTTLYQSSIDVRWGHAPIAFFRLLGFALGGIQDTGIIVCNIVLSSCVPLLLAAFAIALGVSRRGALVAAFVVAAHPFPIAFSGVLNRQPTYQFAAFASLLAVTRLLTEVKVRHLACFVIATLLAVLSRPEGAHVFVVDACVLVAFAAPRARKAWLAAVVVTAAVASAMYLRSANVGAGMQPRALALRWGDLVRLKPWVDMALFRRDLTPLAWAIAWFAGIAANYKKPAAHVAALGVLALGVLWHITGLTDSYVGFAIEIASTRYQTILLAPFALGIGLCVDRAWDLPSRQRAFAIAALAVASVLTFRRPYVTLLRPFTVDYEYHFLRRQIRALPRGSLVFAPLGPVVDSGFVGAFTEGPFVGGETRDDWTAAECAARPSARPRAYLYIGASCAELQSELGRPTGATYREWMATCDRWRSMVAGTAVAEQEVPARHIAWDPFVASTIRIGLYPMPDALVCNRLVRSVRSSRPRTDR